MVVITESSSKYNSHGGKSGSGAMPILLRLLLNIVLMGVCCIDTSLLLNGWHYLPQTATALTTVSNDVFERVTLSASYSLSTPSNAASACSSKNTATKGWYLAAVRSSAAMNGVRDEIVGTTERCLIGGYGSGGTSYFFQSTSPRMANSRIWCKMCDVSYGSCEIGAEGPFCYSRGIFFIDYYYQTKTTSDKLYLPYMNTFYGRPSPSYSGTYLTLSKIYIYTVDATTSSPPACAICAAYKCNYDDDFASTLESCTNQGVVNTNTWHPHCSCICNKGYYGDKCQNTYTKSLTVSISISLPKTHSSTPTVTLPATQSSTISGTAMTATLSTSIPATETLTASKTPTTTTSQSATLSTTLSTSISLTQSSSVTVSLSSSHTGSISQTQSSSVTMSLSSSHTTSISLTSSQSITASQSYSLSTTMSGASPSSSTSTTHTVSISESESVFTVSESPSTSSKCAMINNMHHQPFMCIRYPSDASPISVDLSSYSPCDGAIDDHLWAMGTDIPTSRDWPYYHWIDGSSIPLTLQIDQPLSLSGDIEDYGTNTSRDVDFPQLVEVSQWMNFSSRQGPLRLMVSTTMYFYIFDASDSFALTASSFEPTSNDTQRTTAKRRLLAHLASHPRQRIGVLIRFGGEIEEDMANIDPAMYNFRIPLDAVRCNNELIVNHARVIAEGDKNVTELFPGNTTFETYVNETLLTAHLQLSPPTTNIADLTSTLNAISEALQPLGTSLALAGMLPSSIFAMGVQNSIKEITDCKGYWVPVTMGRSNEVYQVADLDAMAFDDMDFLSSPLGLTMETFTSPGTVWVGPDPASKSALATREDAFEVVPLLGQYMRGAILTSVGLLALTVFLIPFLVIIVWKARRIAKLDTVSAIRRDHHLSTTPTPTDVESPPVTPTHTAATDTTIDAATPPNPPPTTTPTPPPTWWATERRDILDAAAYIQVPSISLLVVAILGDGIIEGCTMLLTLRISFMGEGGDGYASVYRSLGLQKGYIPELIFGPDRGHMDVSEIAPIALDMALSIVLLILMVGYAAHLFYTVYKAPIVVVVVTPPGAHCIGGGGGDQEQEDSDVNDQQHQDTTTPDETLKEEDNTTTPDDALTPSSPGEPGPLSNNVNHIIDPSSLPPTDSSKEDSTDTSSNKEPLHEDASTPPPPTRLMRLAAIGAYLFDPVAELSAPKPPLPALIFSSSKADDTNTNTYDNNDIEDNQPKDASNGEEDVSDDSKIVTPEESIHHYEAGVRWMSRYGLYVGGTCWAYYLPIDFTVAFIIGCMEGFVTGTVPICAGKAIASLLLLLAQFILLVVKRPLSARFDQVSTTISMAFTLLSGTFFTVDLLANRTVPAIEATAQFLMMTAGFTVTIQASIGAIFSIIYLYALGRRISKFIRDRMRLLMLRRRRGQYRSADLDDEPMLEVPDVVVTDSDDPSDSEPLESNNDAVVLDDPAEEAMCKEVEAEHWRVVLDDMEHATPQPVSAADTTPPPVEMRPPTPPPSDPSMLGAAENAHWRTYLDDLEIKEEVEVEDDDVDGPTRFSDISVEL